MRRGTEQRAQQKHLARRIAVGDREKSKCKRTGNEAELDRGSHRTERIGAEIPAALQLSEHGVAREPQGSSSKLGENDDGQNAAWARRVAFISSLARSFSTAYSRIVCSMTAD